MTASGRRRLVRLAGGARPGADCRVVLAGGSRPAAAFAGGGDGASILLFFQIRFSPSSVVVLPVLSGAGFLGVRWSLVELQGGVGASCLASSAMMTLNERPGNAARVWKWSILREPRVKTLPSFAQKVYAPLEDVWWFWRPRLHYVVEAACLLVFAGFLFN
uniref:Uncharacterized protein n=1 Tax=Oryza rufipogon TaxID=4529 RepID=A0A0E0Q7W7_ORYRU